MNFTDSILHRDPRFQDAMRQGAKSGSSFEAMRPVRRRARPLGRLLGRIIHIALALITGAAVGVAALAFSRSEIQADLVGLATAFAILLIERKP